MTSFAAVYALAFVRPRAALESLAAHPRSLRWGGFGVAITATVYTLVYFFLAHNGGRPTVFEPWLAIDAESYYRYNLYFHVPSIALAWISAAGVVQLIARGFGGRGTFETTLAVLGLGISVASWWTGLHDLLTTFAGFMGVLDQRAYEDAMSSPTPARTVLWCLMTGYLLSFLLFFTRGVQVVHRLDTPKAAIAGTAGFLVYQLVFVVFNR